MKGSALSDLHRRLGAAVREQRTAQGLTQAELGPLFKSDAALVGRVERGAQNIRFSTLIRIFSNLNAPTGASGPGQVAQHPARPATHAFAEALEQTMGIFRRAIHPAAARTTARVAGPRQDHATPRDSINPLERRLLQACLPHPKTATELLEALGYKTRTGNYRVGLNNLLAMGLLEMSMPDRPRSRHQKYRLTAKGRTTLAANDISQPTTIQH